MPFAARIEVENGFLGIWELEEKVDELISVFKFSQKEKTEFKRITSSKRQAEYLAIRILLNLLLNVKNEVYYKPDGRPYLTDNNLNISISHSTHLVVVFISSEVCGIDTEVESRNIDKVAKRFLNAGEQQYIDKSGNQQFLKLLAWCAKEAIFKCSCLSDIQFNEQIIISFPESPINNNFSGTLTQNGKTEYFKLSFLGFKNNIIVYGVEDKKHRDENSG